MKTYRKPFINVIGNLVDPTCLLNVCHLSKASRWTDVNWVANKKSTLPYLFPQVQLTRENVNLDFQVSQIQLVGFTRFTTGILDSRTWCPLKASSERWVMAPIESTWIWTWRKSTRQGILCVSWWISGSKISGFVHILTNNVGESSSHQSQSELLAMENSVHCARLGEGDGITLMTCFYQYGRDSSWRPTHLHKWTAKANFFQHEGKLARQAPI